MLDSENVKEKHLLSQSKHADKRIDEGFHGTQQSLRCGCVDVLLSVNQDHVP